MPKEGTLLIGRGEVARLLSLPDCIAAVEEVFRAYGEGKVPPPGVLGIKGERWITSRRVIDGAANLSCKTQRTFAGIGAAIFQTSRIDSLSMGTMAVRSGP